MSVMKPKAYYTERTYCNCNTNKMCSNCTRKQWIDMILNKDAYSIDPEDQLVKLINLDN